MSDLHQLMSSYKFSEGRLEVNSHTVYYQLFFPKAYTPIAPVVFLHEGLGSIEQWKDFPMKLMQNTDEPFLLYDRPGYGKSSEVRERDAFYLHAEAENLKILLAKLEITQAVRLFGHSDGATLALIFAALYPDLCESIIIEAPHVFIEEVTVNGVKRAMKEWSTGSLKKRIIRYHGNKAQSMFSSWAKFWSKPENHQWNIIAEMNQIICPVLFIQGDNDHFGSFEQGRKIAENCKGNYAEFLLSDCGHIPHLEKEKEVIKASLDFWKVHS